MTAVCFYTEWSISSNREVCKAQHYRPHYFYCPSPDFTSRCADCRANDTSTVSQSLTNNHCAPSCGSSREKWGHIKKISAGASPTPTCKLLPTPLGYQTLKRGSWNIGLSSGQSGVHPVMIGPLKI